MTKFIFIITVLLILSYLFLPRANSEAKEKKETVIFSAFKGQITFKGSPLAGIKVSRTYPNSGGTEDITEVTYTDEEGYFNFDKVTQKLGIMAFLPHEAVIHQTINAHYQGKEHLIWYTCKRNYENLGEFQFLDQEVKLSPAMTLAYKDNYILINSDLSNTEEIIQKVNDYTTIISIADLKFPYEQALKEYAEKLISRENEFTRAISQWFENNTDFLLRAINDEDHWSEMQLQALIPYKNAVIESVDAVNYSEHLTLSYFVEDFDKNSQRVSIDGDIILNAVTPENSKIKARVWFMDAIFSVSPQEVTFSGQEHYFGVNSSNIDPSVVD
jgi:hypothetical protein